MFCSTAMIRSLVIREGSHEHAGTFVNDADGGWRIQMVLGRFTRKGDTRPVAGAGGLAASCAASSCAACGREQMTTRSDFNCGHYSRTIL